MPCQLPVDGYRASSRCIAHGVAEWMCVVGVQHHFRDARDLPSLDADGKAPKNLAEDYGELIMQADGFAQVRPAVQVNRHPALAACQHTH